MTLSILERLKTERNPLIDDNVATFVWQGERAPYLVGDFTGWDAGDPAILAKCELGIWTYQLALPPDAYIEYGFVDGEEHLRDPFNPRRSPNGMGGYNHYFFMANSKPTPLARKEGNIPHGTVTKHVIQTERFIVGNKRTVFLYQPPVNDPVPLVVVWDGPDYLHRAHLNNIVDNLIAQQRIRPVALALVENGGPARGIEYACSESTLGFLMTEVLPLANKELNLVDINAFPGAYGVLGASMGGLMALYTGVRIPQVFSHVISQSGAFSWAGFDMVIFDLLEHGELRPLKVWMDVGIYDIPSLLVANRRMQTLLSQKGYALKYGEYNAGHNFPAWRNEIWRGFEYLFGMNK
jgi:enterochelin esterase family protein